MIKNDATIFTRNKKLPVLRKVKKNFKWNLDRNMRKMNNISLESSKQGKVNCSVELDNNQIKRGFDIQNGILVRNQRATSCSPGKQVRFVDDIKTNPRSLIPSPLFRGLDKGEILKSFVTAIKYENIMNLNVIKRNTNCIRSIYKLS